MTTILDYYGPHDRAFMDCIKTGGADGIARYLTNSATDPRQLTPQEVADAHAAGLAVHMFYEMSPTYAGYFTYAQGLVDCGMAINRLTELGAPDGTVVYFAVDAPASTIPVTVLDAYFNGIEAAATPKITPGIYGFEAHVQYARTRFPNVGKHTWQTYGVYSHWLSGWQHLQEDRCGVAVDVNEVSVPGWAPEGGTVSAPIYQGSSVTNVNITVGEVAQIEGIWQYAGLNRHITQKVYGTTPGIFPVTLYPPADPDADPTLVLNVQPAYFVVAVRNS